MFKFNDQKDGNKNSKGETSTKFKKINKRIEKTKLYIKPKELLCPCLCLCLCLCQIRVGHEFVTMCPSVRCGYVLCLIPVRHDTGRARGTDFFLAVSVCFLADHHN